MEKLHSDQLCQIKILSSSNFNWWPTVQIMLDNSGISVGSVARKSDEKLVQQWLVEFPLYPKVDGYVEATGLNMPGCVKISPQHKPFVF